MKAITESKAKQKLCPFFEKNCYASDCMMWEFGKDLIPTAEIPWPSEIPKAQFSKTSDMDDFTYGHKLRLAIDNALHPLIGRRSIGFESFVIAGATCLNPHNTDKVTLTGAPVQSGNCTLKSMCPKTP